jgi:hypothetical protein
MLNFAQTEFSEVGAPACNAASGWSYTLWNSGCDFGE